MQKTHPLARLQLFLGILWLVSFCILPNSQELPLAIWFLIMVVPYLGLSIVTIYMGWVMVMKKGIIIYPFESFVVRIAGAFRGQQAAKNLLAQYSKPAKQKLIGILNIISGLFCLLFVVMVIIGILWFP